MNKISRQTDEKTAKLTNLHRFLIHRTMSARMSTGEVSSRRQPQSAAERGDTPNISCPKLTIMTCPTKMTRAMPMKLTLNEVFTSASRRNAPQMS